MCQLLNCSSSKTELGINTQEENDRGTICRVSLNDGSNACVFRDGQVDYLMGGMIQY